MSPPPYIKAHDDERTDDMRLSDVKHSARYMDVAYTQSSFWGLYVKRMNLRISAELLVQLCSISNFNHLVSDDVFEERCMYRAKSVFGVNISRWPVLDGQFIPQNTIDVAYGMFQSYKQRHSMIVRPFRRAAIM